MDEAKKHFLDGSKAYNLGEFARAVEEYKAAYNALPDPSFLYNIAQAYRLSGDLQQALFFYKSYLHNLSPGAAKREVEQHIAQIEHQLALHNAIVTAPPTGAAPPTATTPEPPPSTIETPPSSATVELTTPPPPGEPKPAYKKGWVWGVVVVGVVVAAGLGVGLGIGLTRGNAPSAGLGTNKIPLSSPLAFSFGGGK